MRILALDAAGERCSACLLEDGVILAEAEQQAAFGQPAILPGLVARVLAGRAIDHVAVGVGPGGFTGIRTALALALGLADGHGVGISGVSAREALALLAENPAGREVWSAIDNRRGGIFLERPGEVPLSLAEAALPPPMRPVLVAGNAAARVVARLLARGQPAGLGRIAGTQARGVAMAAAAALAAGLPPGAAAPLYIDQPAVT